LVRFLTPGPLGALLPFAPVASADHAPRFARPESLGPTGPFGQRDWFSGLTSTGDPPILLRSVPFPSSKSVPGHSEEEPAMSTRTLALGAITLSLIAGAAIGAPQANADRPASATEINDQAPLALRYRWNAGDVLRYRIVQRTESIMADVPGYGDLVINQEQDSDTTMRVRSVEPDGTAHIDWSFDSVRAVVDQPGAGRMIFDSSQPASEADDPMTGAMRALVGRTISLVIAPDGTVRSMGGVDAMREAVRAQIAGTPAETMRPNMKAFLGDDALRDQFEHAFRQLPAEPVCPGQTWERTERRYLPLSGSVEASTQWKFIGMRPSGAAHGTLAKVASASSVNLSTMLGETARSVYGRPTLAGSAIGGSTAWMDPGTGRLALLESTMAAPLTVTRRLKSGETVTIQIDCSSHLNMELIGTSNDPAVADADALIQDDGALDGAE